MVIPDSGKIWWATWAISPGGGTEDFQLHLYQNNIVLLPSTITSDFDEADFAGYAIVGVPRDEFAAPIINTDGQAQSLLSFDPTFSSTDTTLQTVYGWYLTGLDSGDTLACQEFTTSVDMILGRTIILSPYQILLDEMVEALTRGIVRKRTDRTRGGKIDPNTLGGGKKLF